MLKTKVLMSLVLLSSMFLWGCASARLVRVKPGEGGTIAVRSSTADREKAQVLMAQNCGLKRVHIVSEQEVVTGEVTREREDVRISQKQKKRRSRIYGQKDSTATTTQLKEWHITYACL